MRSTARPYKDDQDIPMMAKVFHVGEFEAPKRDLTPEERSQQQQEEIDALRSGQDEIKKLLGQLVEASSKTGAKTASTGAPTDADVPPGRRQHEPKRRRKRGN